MARTRCACQRSARVWAAATSPPRPAAIYSFGRKDGLKHGIIACWRGEQAWELWKAGSRGD
eukprot:15440939-Alexandrium_andersonii.AAC.1